MPDPSATSTTVLLVALVVTFAAMVKATTGFGFGLVAAPLLLLFLDPRLVVPLLVPLTFVLDLLIVREAWRSIEFSRVLPMVAAGAVGVPLGNYVLLVAPAESLKVGIAGLILAFALVLLLGFRLPVPRERVGAAGAGFASGLLLTSAGIPGPPMALFLVNQRYERDRMRRSLAAFFVLLDIVGIVSLLGSGAMSARTLAVDALVAPLVVLGYVVATVAVVPRIRSTAFHRLATLLVAATALTAIVGAVARLG